MLKISIIIAAKEKNKKLKELIHSIRVQDYPKDLVETIIVTEGTPESAKAIGLKKSTGDIVCFLASDCFLQDRHTLRTISWVMGINGKKITGAFSYHYYYNREDPILNRYFALFGFNDPIPFYLGKCDRYPQYVKEQTIFWKHKYYRDAIPTLGDNGFFVWRDLIINTNMDNYSHIDNCEDLRKMGHWTYVLTGCPIWHRTGDSLCLWIKKRLHYGETLSVNRRWRMIEKRDYLKLIYFIFVTLTLIEPIARSCYGYSKIKDKAWFLHPFMCLVTLFTYGTLVLKKLSKGIKICPIKSLS